MKLIEGIDYRKISRDKMFYRVCLEDGMHPFRAWYMYRSVRMWSNLTRIKKKYK